MVGDVLVDLGRRDGDDALVLLADGLAMVLPDEDSGDPGRIPIDREVTGQ
jgi:hypothetical protein